MGKSKSIFGFLIIALFCTLVSTQAVEAASEEWEFTLSFFPFLAGIDGEVTVKGSKSSVDVGFSDLLDVLDFGLGAHFEVKKGKFGFFFEPTYMKLSVEEQVDPLRSILCKGEARFRDKLCVEVGFPRAFSIAVVARATAGIVITMPSS